MGDELCYIESMVKNLPSEKEEGVKALPFIEGGGVLNVKFEARISFRQLVMTCNSGN